MNENEMLNAILRQPSVEIVPAETTPKILINLVDHDWETLHIALPEHCRVDRDGHLEVTVSAYLWGKDIVHAYCTAAPVAWRLVGIAATPDGSLRLRMIPSPANRKRIRVHKPPNGPLHCPWVVERKGDSGWWLTVGAYQTQAAAVDAANFLSAVISSGVNALAATEWRTWLEERAAE